MNISNDENRINELQIALNHYVKGLIVSKNNKCIDWEYEIKRMTEHSLVKYGVIDIRQHNFLELTNTEFNDNYIYLTLSNEWCKYAKAIKKIKIKIPYKPISNNTFEMISKIKIQV